MMKSQPPQPRPPVRRRTLGWLPSPQGPRPGPARPAALPCDSSHGGPRPGERGQKWGPARPHHTPGVGLSIAFPPPVATFGGPRARSGARGAGVPGFCPWNAKFRPGDRPLDFGCVLPCGRASASSSHCRAVQTLPPAPSRPAGIIKRKQRARPGPLLSALRPASTGSDIHQPRSAQAVMLALQSPHSCFPTLTRARPRADAPCTISPCPALRASPASFSAF